MAHSPCLHDSKNKSYAQEMICILQDKKRLTSIFWIVLPGHESILGVKKVQGFFKWTLENGAKIRDTSVLDCFLS